MGKKKHHHHYDEYTHTDRLGACSVAVEKSIQKLAFLANRLPEQATEMSLGILRPLEAVLSKLAKGWGGLAESLEKRVWIADRRPQLFIQIASEIVRNGRLRELGESVLVAGLTRFIAAP